MSMTRKHFEAVARAVANATLTEDDRAHIAKELAREIKSVSGNLDRSKFLSACNIKETTTA